MMLVMVKLKPLLQAYCKHSEDQLAISVRAYRIPCNLPVFCPMGPRADRLDLDYATVWPDDVSRQNRGARVLPSTGKLSTINQPTAGRQGFHGR